LFREKARGFRREELSGRHAGHAMAPRLRQQRDQPLGRRVSAARARWSGAGKAPGCPESFNLPAAR